MEQMEMPTRCSCGKWFDLHDGYPNHKRTETICEDCALQNEKRTNILSDIEYYKSEIKNHENEIEILKNMISDKEVNLEDMPEFI